MSTSDDNHVTYIGTTDFRNQQIKFGIKSIDRSRHMYVIGKTGMGKSTVLENLAVQDIANGDGIVFIDPHGSAIEKLLDYVPEHRLNDVIYFAPFDTDFPISFNVMEDVGPDHRHLVVGGLMASFKKIWQDVWSDRMAYILTNTLLALLEYPNSTLLGVNRMYGDKQFRDMIIANISDNAVKSFWIDEYNKWDPKYAREACASIQNKIGQFTGNPLIRNIIGQQKSSFDFRKAMDEKKIVLVNLSKGLIGEENMRLLGGMIITKLYLSAMSRADVGTYALDTLPPCYFFVDEFQNFANESFADILAEARKYKLNLTVANQYIAQMEETVRDAVFGNVGTTISFRVGPFDAEMLERAFMPVFSQEDLVNMARFQMYLTLSIDGSGSRPFSAKGLPPITKPAVSYKDGVINSSRANYAKPRAQVEQDITSWFTPVAGSAPTNAEGKEVKRGASASFNPDYKPAGVAEKPTPIIETKKPFPPIPVPVVKNEPQPKMSDTLRTLVDELDAHPAALEAKKLVESKPVVLAAPAIIKKEEPKPTVSAAPVTTFKKPVQQFEKKPFQPMSRAANTDQKQALRDLLKKVTPVASAPKPAPQVVEVPKMETAQPAPIIEAPIPEIIPEPKPAPVEPVPQPAASAYIPSRPKEIPEDILRKVLE